MILTCRESDIKISIVPKCLPHIKATNRYEMKKLHKCYIMYGLFCKRIMSAMFAVTSDYMRRTPAPHIINNGSSACLLVLFSYIKRKC